VGSGCRCQTPFGSQYRGAVAVRSPPPSLASPPQLGSPLACGHRSSRTPGGLAAPWPWPLLPRDGSSRSWLLPPALPAAAGRPCRTPLLWSVCSRNGNRCERSRTLQRVALSGDTVENPSLQLGLVVCWRLRRSRSSSSCWHSPAFVHHIWPRWKLNRAQVSLPTYPSTTPSLAVALRPGAGQCWRCGALGQGPPHQRCALRHPSVPAQPRGRGRMTREVGPGTQTSACACPCRLRLAGPSTQAIAMAAVAEVCAVLMRQGCWRHRPVRNAKTPLELCRGRCRARCWREVLGVGGPHRSGECGEVGAGTLDPSVSPQGAGLPTAPLTSRGARRPLHLAWSGTAGSTQAAAAAPLAEKARGQPVLLAVVRARVGAARGRGAVVLRGCGREQVRAAPGRRGRVCCMAPCPSPAACVSPGESVARVHVSGCVCRGESRGVAARRCHCGGLRGCKCRLLGAASRGARVASPQLPVRPLFPWELVPGRERVLPAAPHPAWLLPWRGSARPGAATGLPGRRGSHLRAATEGLSAGSAVLMSLRILFILYRALFDV